MYEKYHSTMENKGGGMGSDIYLLQNIRNSKQKPRSTSFYGDVWDYLYQGLPQGSVLFGQNIQGIGDVNRPQIITDSGS